MFPPKDWLISRSRGYVSPSRKTWWENPKTLGSEKIFSQQVTSTLIPAHLSKENLVTRTSGTVFSLNGGSLGVAVENATTYTNYATQDGDVSLSKGC